MPSPTNNSSSTGFSLCSWGTLLCALCAPSSVHSVLKIFSSLLHTLPQPPDCIPHPILISNSHTEPPDPQPRAALSSILEGATHETQLAPRRYSRGNLTRRCFVLPRSNGHGHVQAPLHHQGLPPGRRQRRCLSRHR